MQMKKILGILLVVCFLMSVTAAAVCADANPVNNYKPVNDPVNNYKPVNSPVNNYKPVNDPVNNYKPVNNHVDNYNPGNNHVDNYNPGNNHVDNYNPGNNHVNNYRPGEKPFFKQTAHKKMHKAGYWGYQPFWHNKDKNHKIRWFTKERHYFPGYDYYI
jgi:hypothetical protein